MNEGLKAWYARLALTEFGGLTMAKKFLELTKDLSPERRERIEATKAFLRQECDEWWVGDELVTRWECERQLGENDDD